MDIKTIKVVLGGAGLNEANDKLILDAEQCHHYPLTL
jgi:hypothetical protein